MRDLSRDCLCGHFEQCEFCTRPDDNPEDWTSDRNWEIKIAVDKPNKEEQA